MSWIALYHHTSWLESTGSDFVNRKLLVVSLLSRDNRSVRRKHEMDSWIRDQIGLEFGDIYVKSTIKSETCGQRRDNLSDKSVQVSVSWLLDVKISSADVINCFVIQHNSNVGMLEKRVGTQDGVIRLYNCGGDLRGRVDGESQLRLLSVINTQSF